MKKAKFIATALVITSLFNGCSIKSNKSEKVKDLEFTVVEDADLPDELSTLINEKKQKAFKLTCTTNDYLYISVGYGEQSTGGYSICVNELYLTENAIYVDTNLLGPGTEDNKEENSSYPYIVIKLEKMDETVVFK